MKIRQFYLNEFPADELGQDINPNATMFGLIEVMSGGRDIYEYLAVDDSLIRERVFEQLADMLYCDYEDIYGMWMGN